MRRGYEVFSFNFFTSKRILNGWLEVVFICKLLHASRAKGLLKIEGKHLEVLTCLVALLAFLLLFVYVLQ